MSLRGIILRDEGAELVIQATPEQVRTFANSGARDVVVSRGRMSMTMDAAEVLMHSADVRPSQTLFPGQMLYNEYGLAVAEIREINIHSDRLDVTTFGGPNRHIQGLVHVDIRCLGL
jgi:hypothetical protein